MTGTGGLFYLYDRYRRSLGPGPEVSRTGTGGFCNSNKICTEPPATTALLLPGPDRTGLGPEVSGIPRKFAQSLRPLRHFYAGTGPDRTGPEVSVIPRKFAQSLRPPRHFFVGRPSPLSVQFRDRGGTLGQNTRHKNLMPPVQHWFTFSLRGAWRRRHGKFEDLQSDLSS